MTAAIFASGQVGEDAPVLVGLYDSVELAKVAAPTYTGVLIVDFNTGDIFEREYREVSFRKLSENDAVGI